jgi:hypothetical protein
MSKSRLVKKLEKELEKEYGREKVKSIYTIGFLERHPEIWKEQDIAGFEKHLRDTINWYYGDAEFARYELNDMTIEQLEKIFYSDDFKEFKEKFDKEEKEFEKIRRE